MSKPLYLRNFLEFPVICWDNCIFWHFWPPFDPRGACKSFKTKFLILRNVPKLVLSFCQLLLGGWAIFDLFNPDLTPGCPKKCSTLEIFQKWLPQSNFSYEKTNLCKFGSFTSYLLGDRHIVTILTIIWPLGTPNLVKTWNKSKMNTTLKFLVWNDISSKMFEFFASYL